VKLPASESESTVHRGITRIVVGYGATVEAGAAAQATMASASNVERNGDIDLHELRDKAAGVPEWETDAGGAVKWWK
jgi:hypothetical protein